MLFFAFILFENESVSKNHLPYKVGVIIFSEEFRDSFNGLKAGIKQYGYKNIEFYEENINGDLSKVDAILKSFKDKEIKIIFTTTTPLNQKIKELNDKYNFYVIFTQVASPKESGLIKDDKNSGTNFVGVSRAAFITVKKRLKIFKDAFPDLNTIVIFYNPTEKFLEKHTLEYKPFLDKEEINLIMAPIKNEIEIDNYKIENPKNTGIFMAPSAFSVKYFKNIKKLAERNRIPIMAIDTYLVEKGAALAYSQSFFNDGFQSSYYLNLLFKGIEPKHLPIQLPEKMELVLNKKVIDNVTMRFNKVYYGYTDRILE